jgi:hypothetical protein
MSINCRRFAAKLRIAEAQRVKLLPLADDCWRDKKGCDPLACAIPVAREEDELGIDPLTIGGGAAFQLTIGNFVRAYQNVRA